MSYFSPITENSLIIDEDNADTIIGEVIVDGEGMGKGLESRDLSEDPIGGFATRFALPLIPRSEWKDRIEQREKAGATLRALIERAGIKVKNQSNTNYCWANAPVFAMEVIRMLQGEQHVSLSPASVAAVIKNFKNVGGWGTQALKFIAEKGVIPSSVWPDNAINKKYYTQKNEKLRSQYKALEWWDLKPRSFDEKMTCLFYGVPVACGYNWWGHEILALDPVLLKSGKFGTMEANSWGSNWGDNGYVILAEAKSVPDDAIAPKVAVAS